MSFWNSFTSRFSFGPIGDMFAGWNSYNPHAMFTPNITQMSSYPTMNYNFSFNGISNLGYNSVFNSQNYFNKMQIYNYSSSIYSPINQSISVSSPSISTPISFGFRFSTTSKKYSDSSSSASKKDFTLQALKGKHFSEMTDSQLQQVYGDYTRDITKLYEGTAEDLNKYLKGKGVLEGKGQAFIDAQDKYGISASVLVGIAMNESAKGTSDIAKNKNNVGGVRKLGSTQFRTFDSVNACIIEMARFLNVGYVNNTGRPLTKLYQINAKYCPTSDPTDKTGNNGLWAKAVDKYAKEVDAALT